MRTVTLLAGVLLAAGCSSGGYEYLEADKPKVFKVASRQHAPDPVYSRTTWVRPPQVLPTRERDAKTKPLILPVIHYTVDGLPLKEAALILAATSRYRSYTAPSIEGQKISINSLGTIEELAQEIENKAGVRVVIDHENEEIRVLPGATAQQY